MDSRVRVTGDKRHSTRGTISNDHVQSLLLFHALINQITCTALRRSELFSTARGLGILIALFMVGGIENLAQLFWGRATSQDSLR